jgi:nucleotide-binding universal stress UspA family protein
MTATSPHFEGSPTATEAPTFVVPLDDSDFAERAVPVAETLARRLGGSVLLAPTAEARMRALTYRAEPGHSLPAPTEIAAALVAPAAPSVRRIVHDTTGGVLCMSTHGRGAVGWAVLGSFTEAVLREHDAPVILVGSHCHASWDRGSYILVCVDGARGDDPVVPVAIHWARALGLSVHVAHVMHPLDVEGATHPDRIVDAVVNQFTAAGVDAAPRFMRASYVAGAIADEAAYEPAALIAMNTHGRKGFARFALGSVAMATVGLAPCPVLVAPLAHNAMDEDAS